MSKLVAGVSEREGAVVLTFHGRHTAAEAQSCISVALRLFAKLGKCQLVVDFRDLQGYDPAARVAWQEKLADLRGSIDSITVIGGTALARMAAAGVGLYARIEMRFVKDIEEVFAPSAKRAS